MTELTRYLIKSTVDQPGIVKVWEEQVAIPTYEIGMMEKNPIFAEKRVYQGSSGVVYPYPIIEKISDKKQDKIYQALFLENEYIKVMILPELGGRIHMAYDKIRERHFVYYNEVIKPALVGLTGPWISGGIEFNWPQHHRPTTFLPTEYLMEQNADGSVTVWCNEIERMFRMKAMQGFTLHPDKAYIEIKVQVYNRTALPQTFLWWANPAVVVNDDYYSVFPPDVNAVFDHGKREVSSFPIATGTYYKYDYSAGVDIAQYKNIPVPTSYMAIQSKYNFVGGYEAGKTNAGMLHVADHHISPGKKQWTWGNGDFGVAWDRNLTDENGPYIELMAGVYTDNQPDFAWLQPYEVKSWSQYFMPYAEVGQVKNATQDAVLNMEIEGQTARIVLYTSGVYEGLRVLLRNTAGKIYLEEQVTCSPRNIYTHTVAGLGNDPQELICAVYDKNGNEMLSYQPELSKDATDIPEPAQAALLPEDIPSIEELFLTGQHLEQYRHATYDPLDYYREALRREPKDIRCNNALGAFLLRNGKIMESIGYFETAIARATERNPNPYDGEPYYNLGLALQLSGDLNGAYGAFYKATWNAAWKDSGYFGLAQIDAKRADWHAALEKVNHSLSRNWYHHKGRQLKASILRKLGAKDTALAFIRESLELDPFNMGCRFEWYLIRKEESLLSPILDLSRVNIHSVIEYALDFAHAGLYEEASLLLEKMIEDAAMVYPMVYYTLGYLATHLGQHDRAAVYCDQAMAMDPTYCFPNRLEEIAILRHAISINHADAKALYYLGNLWYGKRQHQDAVGCWEQSIQLDGQFPTVFRNLALAYYNRMDRMKEAVTLLERAFSLDESDARLLMELHQLYKKQGYSYQERLALLDRYPDLVAVRDDLFLERITLFNLLGEYEVAKQFLASRRFKPWEGGEGKVSRQYTICHLELAKKSLQHNELEQALCFLNAIDHYPHNLGEGKLITMEENDIYYYKGLVCRLLEREKEAKFYFSKATEGAEEPQQALFYNDPQPDKIFYQGLAWRELGDPVKAEQRFQCLIDHGKKFFDEPFKIDYFAVSLPDMDIWEEDLDHKNKIHCLYVMGLGYLGKGDAARAMEYLSKVKQLDLNHQGSQSISYSFLGEGLFKN
ncbi:DUF5107 domain-containing protein [Sphingobacterium sp.]|uniref:DUF5107 domain-containing protein n=1 Tax=Sphingobacterium sp. TaxID=341027 RepID=UPI0028A015A1|nr:DUF5107 domain-containing protein [Sphingobacterium sp.]